MAKKTTADKAKAKAAREKKLAIGGAVLLVLVLAYEGPKTLKMLSPPQAHLTPSAATTPPPAPTGSLAAPSLGAANPVGGAPATTTTTSGLVSAVPVSVDQGQLSTFERFATKDPFANPTAAAAGPAAPTSPTPPSSGSGGSSGGGPSSGPPAAPPAPPAPPPTSAVIKLNGVETSVSVGSAFPTSGPIFTAVGSLFLLKSLTSSSAKVAIAGGSLASGGATVTLKVGKPLTLENTADGTRYTLVLEPQGTVVPTSTSPGTTTGTSTTSTTSTNPATPVVPSGG